MYKLIIIDDEKIIRETIGAQIDWNEMGVELIGLCANGIEGLDMIIDENPDIVMTDIRMPVFSGLELIERIRQLNKDIEFIILSGYSEFEYARTAMKLNVKHYILKPCSKETIINTVEQVKKDCREKKNKSLPSYIFKKVSNLSKEFTKKKRPSEDILKDLFIIMNGNKDFDYTRAVALSFITNIWYSCDNLYEPSMHYSELKNTKTLQDIQDFLEHHLEFIDHQLNKKTELQETSNGFIKKCIEYTEENFSNPSLTLKYIAETHLFMNVDYVSRQFYKITGDKFSTFLGKLRVENAKEMIRKNPNERIYIIAEMVGCGNNPQYLSQLFKKYAKMTPSAYASTLKKGEETH